MSTSLSESERKNLYRVTMEGKWEKVVEIYKENPGAHKMRVTHEGGTALHLAVIEFKGDIVSKLVQEISKIDKKALEIKNDKGDTPLHHAASVGCKIMCKHIVEAAINPSSLIGIRTDNGETALFIAAINGNKEAFLYLHSMCSATSDSNLPDHNRYSYTRRSKTGDNILHAAINNGHFDLAYQIIHLYRDLVDSVNEKGLTPFHCLAKSSAFKSCSYNLGLWKGLIYKCIVVKKLQFEVKNEQEGSSTSDVEIPISDEDTGSQSTIPCNEMRGIFPASYKKFVKVLGLKSIKEIVGETEDLKKKHKWSFQLMEELFKRPEVLYKHKDAGMKKGKPSSKEEDKDEDEDDDMEETFKLVKRDAGMKKGKPSSEEEDKDKDEDDDMEETFKLVKRDSAEKEKIPKKREETDGIALMAVRNGMVEIVKKCEKEKIPVKREETDGIALMAVRNGVVEIVKKCLEVFPAAIHDRDEDGKSMLILAAENRDPQIFNLIEKMISNRATIFLRADSGENNVLHAAATYNENKPWPIPGVALQMQREIKWFEFVKTSIPRGITLRPNLYEKTPEEVFSITHKELATQGRDWLIKTSESCSVVAALIAGVAFATIASVPGGTLDTSGKPVFERQPAFQVFSISSLIALCFAFTALVMFLAIITSRFQEKDFTMSLPLKLLLGLSSLFVSIGATLVCFCTGHFFMIGDRLKNAAYPVYALTCFPASIFAAAQFPLYIDLFLSIFTNPFKHRGFRV